MTGASLTQQPTTIKASERFVVLLPIPYDEVEQKFSHLPRDKNAKIVLYCRSGHMSTIAAETLVNLGYTSIWELDVGMQAWDAAGYALQDH